MHVRVNGKSIDLPERTTIAALVQKLGLTERSVAVERNGEPVARAAYDTAIEPGDVLEVVRPVQGGAAGIDGARLYLVCPPIDLDLLDRLIDAGVDIVQLRDKTAEAGVIVERGRAFAAVCRARGVPFIVNDRPDIALACEADGVHLGQDDLPPEVARRILGPHAIIGRSTHSPDDIEHALREHAGGLADYVAVGPLHETPTKPGRAATGLDLLDRAAERVHFPWFAIGGITTENVGAIVGRGARRIVVVRAIVDATDPVATTRQLREALG